MFFLSKKTGRRLVVLCLKCTEREANKNEDVGFLSLPEPNVEKELAQFEAEKN
jgi:hypothetical protein